MRLKNKVAIITGASGGIGQATARAFAAAGAKLLLHANRHIEKAIALVREIEKSGGEAAMLTADLSLSSRQVDFIEGALSMYPKVDILVNAAGVDLMREETQKLSFNEKLEYIFAVDVQANVRISKIAGEWMRNTVPPEQGKIIMLGWDGVSRGMEGETAQLYAIAKGAITAFARSLAQSLAPHVRVNTIAPGWITTGWGRKAPREFRERAEKESLLGRWGTPEEVAELALFLASDESSFLNGQCMEMNGGFDYRGKKF